MLQSTLPRGERRPTIEFSDGFGGFNPRSRAGSDDTSRPVKPIIFQLQSTLPRGERLARRLVVGPGQLASIHAPARGATRPGGRAVDQQAASIHAPARGATDKDGHYPLAIVSFNPRSRAGSDTVQDNGGTGIYALQSTLPRGERPRYRHPPRRCHRASIHAPARGATPPCGYPSKG